MLEPTPPISGPTPTGQAKNIVVFVLVHVAAVAALALTASVVRATYGASAQDGATRMQLVPITPVRTGN